jgi:hypothetical protein
VADHAHDTAAAQTAAFHVEKITILGSSRHRSLLKVL